jgi:hypothetical protein
MVSVLVPSANPKKWKAWAPTVTWTVEPHCLLVEIIEEFTARATVEETLIISRRNPVGEGKEARMWDNEIVQIDCPHNCQRSDA